MNIEDDFRPETASEVALLDRIGELRRKLWEAGRFHNTVDGFAPDPNDVPTLVKDFSPTLRLAGASEASLELPKGLRIEARTYGPLSLGVANYVGMSALEQLSLWQEAQILTSLHEKVIHQTGKLIQDKLRG